MASKILCFVALSFLASTSWSLEISKDSFQDSSARQGKVFSLFTVVNFENNACESTSSLTGGGYRNGTCFTSSECGDKGGTAKGNCASGFGVCCVFMISDTTTSSVNYNNTYIQNPSFPSTYAETTALSYTVAKVNEDVCFLRLDFEDFTIVGPANSLEWDNTGTPAPTFADTAGTGGKCESDVLKITPPSSAGQTVPEICGKNTGQHLYISMGPSSTDTATIALSFAGDSSVRKWEIKATQVECGINSPPDGCLQYYTGISGQLMTFNFLDTATTHLASQQYNICMRKESGYCCIKYSVCDTTTYPNAFSLYRFDAAAIEVAKVDSDCTEDYITIDGGQGVCGQGNTYGRYCSLYMNPTTATAAVKFSIPVCDCTPPFQVGVATDATADAKDPAATTDYQSRGVCLDFMQVTC